MNTLKIVLYISAAAAIGGVLIAFVSAQAGPAASEAAQTLARTERETVLPAASYLPVVPDTLWQAFDTTRCFQGLIFRVAPKGYKGTIPILAGVDTAGLVTGVAIDPALLHETPGLGAKVATRGFLDQLVGQPAAGLKLVKDGGSIDAISGATISSRAVVSGIRNGYERFSAKMIRCDERSAVMPGTWNMTELIPDSLWLCFLGSDTGGIVFKGFTMGYLDTIAFMAGIDRQGRITGVSVLSSHETEGIGERIREREFLDRFRDTIPDAISGATMTSRPFIKAVYDYRERFRPYWSR